MFRIHTRRIATTLALLSTAALPQTASAASYLDDVKKGKKTAYTASLADIAQERSGITTRTLDWRQPSVDLYFDLPPAERTSEIILTLSADPLTRVAPGTPLQVQFNDGKPVPVLSNGRGFEARLPLDAGESRSKRNHIRISYPTPNGADCVTPAHGAWSIDLEDSSLRMKGRMKSRNMSLGEVSDYLRQPALSPSKVGLIARGPHGTDMQALAAQAISLRTPDVPKFSVVSSNTDFNVVMVKRNRLLDVTKDPMIIKSKGARIFVSRGRPTELIFTADTDAEILKMLEVFATRELPNTRRPISSVGELEMQSRLDRGTQKLGGKTRLLDLAATEFNGIKGAQTFKFKVNEPAATGGELLLRLATTKDIAKDSRLRVVLNGKTLGAAKLDKKRKSVAFDIQPGELNATANILTLMPDIQAKSGFTCSKVDKINPGFSVGYGSSLNLKKNVKSSVTELSQLTASGGLFAKTESYISLPRKTNEYQASLRILGRIAKSTGQGLTSADYTRKSDFAEDKHLLIIGPSYMAKNHMAGAPKALRDAFSGQSSSGDNLLQAAYERSASLGFDDAILKYAAAQAAPRKVRSGGVAALYSAGNGTLTGVISAAPGSSFVTASDTLIRPTHWNAIKGGVVRWTSSTVVMAQTAQSDSKIKTPKPVKSSSFPELGIYAIENLDLYTPEFNWPTFDTPDFSVPQVKLPKIKWPSFKPKKDDLPMLADTLPPAEAIKTVDVEGIKRAKNRVKTAPVKTAQIVPRLKPVFQNKDIRPQTTKVSLRGPFQFSAGAPNPLGSFQDVKRTTKSKWFDTAQWFKKKTKNVTEMQIFEDVAQATDRLQDQAKPAGRMMTTQVQDKVPGKGLVKFGDKTVSAYGLGLIITFGLILLLMSFASPKSRLGGRH